MKTSDDTQSSTSTQLPTTLQLSKYCSQFILNQFRFASPAQRGPDRRGTYQLWRYVRSILREARFEDQELVHTVIGALLLLDRLKRQKNPLILDARGLFTAAVMLAHKCISEESYSLKTWSDIISATFTTRELNKFERDMCASLDWQLNFDPIAFKRLERRILSADVTPLTLADTCSTSCSSEHSWRLLSNAVPASSYTITPYLRMSFAPSAYTATPPPPYVVVTVPAAAPVFSLWVPFYGAPTTWHLP